ncbi:MAG: metal-sulfur cluster assembly factor [Pseudomonadales bacterium]|nr:metal-sulfur cluster assembly factor [Pseudomonadales bacterium]
MSNNDPKVKAIYDALSGVFDPEVGVNIVDLGLIYEVTCTDSQIAITLTLTSAGCPMGDQIVAEAQQAVEQIAQGAEVKVELVWEPFWRPDMMSEEAKKILGW